MSPVTLTFREIIHRWKSGLLFVAIVAVITGAVTYVSVNNVGFQKEISRNARDIGSNVVILPIEVDQLRYHNEGGYSEVTMTDKLVDQLLEHKASLNHLIPMLERKAALSFQSQNVEARVVGISASIPMPGRPKAPMQKSIEKGQVQLGAVIAEQLGIQRDQQAKIDIQGDLFTVSRVNKANGTWQDGAAFIDLESAQTVFGVPNEVSRIEAIECTSEQCELTGLKSDVVLSNELVRITDQAAILRRDQIAKARANIRGVSRKNLQRLQNILWITMALAIAALADLNAVSRLAEVGILQSLGFGQLRVGALFVIRSMILAALGSAIGGTLGALVSHAQGQSWFEVTGAKMMIDWGSVSLIGLIAVAVAAFASCLPAMRAAMRHPADIIGADD